MYYLLSLNVRCISSCIALKVRLLISWLVFLGSTSISYEQASCLEILFLLCCWTFIEIIRRSNSSIIWHILTYLLSKLRWKIKITVPPLLLLPSALAAALVIILFGRAGEMYCSIVGIVVWQESCFNWVWKIVWKRKWLRMSSSETKFSKSV